MRPPELSSTQSRYCVAAATAFQVKVGVRAPLVHCTTDPLTKFVPFTVRVKAAAPAVALPGVSEPSVGTELLTVNVSAPEVPPPGVGENTVTDAVPAVATSLAGIAACNCVPLTNVVVRAPPFPRTTHPFPSRVKGAAPRVAVLGESEPSVGTGLVGMMLIVKVSALELPPPGAGVNTRTEAVPAVAMSAAVIVARSWVALTKVVVRALLFHCTTDPLTKFVPFTVSVNATPPAFVLVGDSEVTVGTGWLVTLRSAM